MSAAEVEYMNAKENLRSAVRRLWQATLNGIGGPGTLVDDLKDIVWDETEKQVDIADY